MLNNVASLHAARRILVGRRSLSRNLLELAIHLRNREFVGHAWCQKVLDQQWCGRDRRCGKVMLASMPSPSELVVLALLGWTGLQVRHSVRTGISSTLTSQRW